MRTRERAEHPRTVNDVAVSCACCRRVAAVHGENFCTQSEHHVGTTFKLPTLCWANRNTLAFLRSLRTLKYERGTDSFQVLQM